MQSVLSSCKLTAAAMKTHKYQLGDSYTQGSNNIGTKLIQIGKQIYAVNSSIQIDGIQTLLFCADRINFQSMLQFFNKEKNKQTVILDKQSIKDAERRTDSVQYAKVCY